MFKVVLSSCDGTRVAKSYKTIKKAREFAVKYVGEYPEFGSTYAVSFDGICTIVVEGCSLQELFFDKPAISLDKPFQVRVVVVDEDRGTSRSYVDNSFDTLAEALIWLNSDELDRCDGVELGWATEQARSEIMAWRKAKDEAYAAKYEDKDFPF